MVLFLTFAELQSWKSLEKKGPFKEVRWDGLRFHKTWRPARLVPESKDQNFTTGSKTYRDKGWSREAYHENAERQEEWLESHFL